MLQSMGSQVRHWLSNWTIHCTPILNRHWPFSNKLPSITSKASIKCKTLSSQDYLFWTWQIIQSTVQMLVHLYGQNQETSWQHRKCILTAIFYKKRFLESRNQNLLMDKVGANLSPCSSFILFWSATLCSKFWPKQREIHSVELVTSGYLPFDSGATFDSVSAVRVRDLAPQAFLLVRFHHLQQPAQVFHKVQGSQASMSRGGGGLAIEIPLEYSRGT